MSFWPPLILLTGPPPLSSAAPLASLHVLGYQSLLCAVPSCTDVVSAGQTIIRRPPSPASVGIGSSRLKQPLNDLTKTSGAPPSAPSFLCSSAAAANKPFHFCSSFRHFPLICPRSFCLLRSSFCFIFRKRSISKVVFRNGLSCPS